jgi:GT2 family glycosyltransferase
MAFDGKTIAAVVVTYNRRPMLERCIEALLKNENLDAIIIVNNASTDDTRAYLETLRSDKPIYIINNIRNEGGAGGFHDGLKFSIAKGFGYSWIMDDDACPLPNALDAFMQADKILNGAYGFLASNVMSDDGEVMNTPVIENKAGNNGYPFWSFHLKHCLVNIKMATFVSIFLKNTTVVRFGLPVKEMFIWGDDSEYTQRISKHEPCYLVGNSEVIHRRVNASALSVINEENDYRLKMYNCLYRNNLYRILEHESFVSLVKFLISSVIVVLKVIIYARDRKLSRIRQITKGCLEGFFFWKRVAPTYRSESK